MMQKRLSTASKFFQVASRTSYRRYTRGASPPPDIHPSKNYVKDLIENQRLFTIDQESTLDKALAIMFSHRIRHLPVVNNENEVVGVLTDRDIRLASSSPVLDPQIDLATDIEKLGKHKVSEVMSRSVLTANANEKIIDACRVMRISKKGCLPVVRSKSSPQLVGIITRSTMLDHLIRVLTPPP